MPAKAKKTAKKSAAVRAQEKAWRGELREHERTLRTLEKDHKRERLRIGRQLMRMDANHETATAELSTRIATLRGRLGL